MYHFMDYNHTFVVGSAIASASEVRGKRPKQESSNLKQILFIKAWLFGYNVKQKLCLSRYFWYKYDITKFLKNGIKDCYV